MKFHKDVPGMVLFRIFFKNLIPSKTGFHGNKTEKILKTLKIFLSETIGVKSYQIWYVALPYGSLSSFFKL